MGLRNLFKKRDKLKQHQFRNLIIYLPSHWHFELEDEDTELCYDPALRSSLRISFLFATYKNDINKSEQEQKLTEGKRYQITNKGRIFLGPINTNTFENETELKITRWELINYTNAEVVYAILSCTVPTNEFSTNELQNLQMIEASLLDAQLSDNYSG